VDFGAHLPLMDFGGHPYTLDHLLAYARAARALGFRALAANDHLVFRVPWLDGPTALAAVLETSVGLTLATTISLPVVRGPVPLAKTLSSIDRLSGGRLVVAVGPGSLQLDYDAVGIAFDERWQRLDECVHVLRALWRRDAQPFVGRFYSTEGITLEPGPAQAGGPPIWIGSWGSAAGLARVARAGDGWLASAYNTTPALFADAKRNLDDRLARNGKDPATFPIALGTMWFHITDDRAEADRIIRERMVTTISRPEPIIRERLAFGPADEFAAKLSAYASAGVGRVYVWPVTDETRQLELFAEQVMPAVS
jgi:alkanesulfonate monooxygenase SsuD/methylene tetrahydromethanopterin reductase-like flavin-dependent oxidoreductase (luciferase family)